MRLNRGGDGLDWFLVAMIEWRRGQKTDAGRWYDRAAQEFERRPSVNEPLRLLWVEAAELFGHEPPPEPIQPPRRE